MPSYVYQCVDVGCISVCAAYFLSINDATPIHSIHYGFLSLKRQQTFVSAVDDECAILYRYSYSSTIIFRQSAWGQMHFKSITNIVNVNTYDT